MTTQDIIIRIVIVLLAILLLITARAFIQAESVIKWCHKEFQKEARLPGRFPKATRLRRIMLFLLSLKSPQPW